MSEHEYYERDATEPVLVLLYQVFVLLLALIMLAVLGKTLASTYHAWRKRRSVALPEHVV